MTSDKSTKLKAEVDSTTIPSQYPHALNLTTNYTKAVLTELLKQYEPWGHRIEFSNGLTTADFKRRVPFSDNPMSKIMLIDQKICLDRIKGGKVLDVGCNSGYNSIYCATKYSMRVVGIDVNPRHIEVSKLLSEIANIDAEYLLGSAETFCRSEEFDLILHLGTLYHLPNPLLSLQTSYTNLKPGGYLALETQCYDDPSDENHCYFMHMHNNDPTNFWALSSKVLQDYIRILGFVDCELIKRVVPKTLENQYMSRVVLVAKK
ncbi:class I SAM-dependent methyltransferase [Okeania sp.]|uniref:class I SAM-dependent methyltransferase n=1 Tax=Okeania sp. TaxID=3100323 RepID=UPI002B4B1393|nr:class I SAM-dependent methyltransferase [Okeania sp.]MEB3341292.1 class I SAM-dependent methyltransferase [Okeania sp.]